MTTDLAIDYNTGDLIVSPTNSIDVRTGLGTVEQRMRVRLRVWHGEWDIDPSLGSRLREVMRMPNWRATSEVELSIREALEPMDDVTVQHVTVTQDPDDARKINVGITYVVNDATDEAVDPLTLTTSLRVGD